VTVAQRITAVRDATAHGDHDGKEGYMAMTLAEAARKTGLTTLAKAIKSGRLSARRKEDDSYEIDPAELARVHPFPATVPAVRRATLDEFDAEVRYRIIRAEESLAELKSALEDMRSQRDAWQAMAQGRLRPKPNGTMSWLRWPRSAA
jgi:hypothetical protein